MMILRLSSAFQNLGCRLGGSDAALEAQMQPWVPLGLWSPLRPLGPGSPWAPLGPAWDFPPGAPCGLPWASLGPPWVSCVP